MATSSSPIETKAEPGERRTSVGQAVPRFENAAILTGRGKYADDIPVKANTLYAAILRSPHAHAEICGIDVSAARACPGVAAVITGEDIKELTDPFHIGFKTDVEYRPLATDRVRYVGEPVAVVVARDRYLAEDALEEIVVDYEPLPAVVDPIEALNEDAPVLHPKVGSNLVSSRRFVHGDPDGAFAGAPRSIEFTIRYPRNSIPPLEAYVVVADYDPHAGSYETLTNFMGPFSLHPVMARALRIDGNKFRLRTAPNAGGSFGVKMTIFPYVVLMCVAARIAGRPVKWVEDRLEHLAAACSAPNRVTKVEAAYDDRGVVSAVRLHHWDDHGGYMRAPMPAPTYRMQGMTTGPYAYRNVDTIIDVVTTNKTPTGAVRGFGAPQLLFATERMMHRIAVDLGLDPLDVIRRNLLKSDVFPYQSPAGALLDSGNYQRLVEFLVERGDLAALKKKRDEARAAGRLYGIGYAAVLEPGQSNMGYISTVKTAEERRRAGPKDGAICTATVSVDPVGGVTVSADSVPQGQGHHTVLAQVVADELGLSPDKVTVNLEMDTEKDGWSIAAGNYACRFGPVVSGTAALAARKIRDKIAAIVAPHLNVLAADIEFGGGRIYSKTNPENGVAFYRGAGGAHWSPGSLPDGMTPGLRETVQWSPPELTPTTERDEINSMLSYGFGFDICAVEVDPKTGEVRIDKYLTAHDVGPILNPGVADGQIRGSFAGAFNAALYEEFVYGDDGSFLSGTFADYLVATAHEMPELTLLHPEEVTPSPFTVLGAKSVSEGNTNSTPVCIANAVADALGVDDLTLPLSPTRILALIGEPEPPPPAELERNGMARSGRALTGDGDAFVPAPVAAVWQAIFDPETLRRVIPGCEALESDGANTFTGVARVGVGPVRGRFRARVSLLDPQPEKRVTLRGDVAGSLGAGSGSGHIELEAEDDGTRMRYHYEVAMSGTIASVGGRMLDGAARVLIRQFFAALATELGGGVDPKISSWRRLFGGNA